MAVLLTLAGVLGVTFTAQGSGVAGNTPTTITAESLSLSGLGYDGVVDVATHAGGAKALKFVVSGLKLRGDVKVSLPRGNGRAMEISGPSATLSTPSVKSVLDVVQLRGKLDLGIVKIPVDFTPENPPPLTIPWLKFTDVTIGVYSVTEGDLDVDAPHLEADADYAELPEPLDIPAPPVDTAKASTTSDCAAVDAPVTEAATTVVGGIRVHKCLAPQVERLLSDAAGDHIDLGGGGFRDYLSQIRTRINNCGSSAYAIYREPADHCSPPTAPPGTSMHERGLAVDFTADGHTIDDKSKAFRWLADHAGGYGLRNLPSEPWHWSTNGR